MAKAINEKNGDQQFPDDFEDMLIQTISPGNVREAEKKAPEPQTGASRETQPAPPENQQSDQAVPGQKEGKAGKKKRSTESELDFILNNAVNIERTANVKVDEVKLKKIKRYVTILGGQGTSMQSYIDNILTLHFQAHEQELHARSQQQL
jgi:hypothetical protein